MARLLRHEVGDLLQSIYATVAILLERLPAELAQERRLISDLKTRAELCKYEMDAAVDLVSPLPLKPARVDLTALVGAALMQARRRYPALPVLFDGTEAIFVHADPRVLSGALTLLILALCQSAQSRLSVRLARASQLVCGAFERDGFPVGADQLAWLEQPFATTQQALFGLALALTCRACEPVGGKVLVTSPAEGGVCVRLSLPASADE